MSEKQFVEDHSYLVHYDNCIFDKGQHKHLYLDEVIDLLNELNEKNQRLKNDCSILIQSNQGYRKENEQLRQELKEIKENPINYF